MLCALYQILFNDWRISKYLKTLRHIVFTECQIIDIYISKISSVWLIADWLESAIINYFSSNNDSLLNTSLQVTTRNQNDWSVTNQIEYAGFRQDSYFSVFVSWLSHYVPALTIKDDRHDNENRLVQWIVDLPFSIDFSPLQCRNRIDFFSSLVWS